MLPKSTKVRSHQCCVYYQKFRNYKYVYKSDGRNKSDVEDEVVFVFFISVGIFLYVQLKCM